MAIDNSVLSDVVSALKQTPDVKNHIYDAQVSRIDDEGTVWVKLADSDKETPTAISSAELERGDVVNVEWRNNQLYIGGNYSNPSAGVARVINVEAIAEVAKENAAKAETAASNAVESANIAAGAAHQASIDAANASSAASSAQSSADNALVGLSTVEDVVGVLNWITEHGTMTLTSDVTVNPAHVYFVVNPNGDYVVGGTHYAIVSEPKDAELSTYYELSVDESVENYVATHVAVDTEGLWLIPENNGTPATSAKKILIATGAGSTYTTAGTYIIEKVGGVDTVTAKFAANGAIIGQASAAHSEIDASGQRFYANDGTTQLAQFTTSGAQIGQSGASHSMIDASGQRIYGGDGTIQLASFTESGATIGQPDSQRIEVSENSFSAYNANSAKFFDVDYNGGATSAQGNFSVGIPHQSFNFSEASIDLVSMDTIDTSGIPNGTVVSFETPSTYNSTIWFYNADLDDSYPPTMTNATVGYFDTFDGYMTFKPSSLPSITIGTTSSSTVSIQATYSNDSSKKMTFTMTIAYDSSANTITTTATLAKTWSATFRGSIKCQCDYKYTVSTPAPSLSFGINDSSTKGDFSSSLGEHLYTTGTHQTSIGKYNVEDNSNKYAFIVGNGTADNARSNAFTVDWNGGVDTTITETSGTYTGGLCDEALLTSATITALQAWLNS